METQIVTPVASPVLMSGVLGPYVTAYCDYLRERRYAARTQHTYLGCVAHFVHWLAAEGLDVEAIDEQAGLRFIGSHLPHCDCTPPAQRMVHEVRAALSHLHQVLRTCGAVPALLPSHIGPIAQELIEFDRYMGTVRGLATNTRRQRMRIVGRLATVSSQWRSWTLRSSRLRKLLLRKKSSRI